MCLRPVFNAFGDLMLRALNAVAEPHGTNTAVLNRCPCQHTHRVGVVQQQRVWLCNITDIATNVQNCWNSALAIHDSAGAEGITYALVDSIFEGNIDVGCKGIEATLTDGAYDVIRIQKGFAAVCCCGNGCGESICLDIALNQLMDHGKVVLIDVHQGEVRASQLRNGQNIGYQTAGKSNRPSTYHRDF